jgi:exopolyphosphatase/guanosine-5'-triphosphate,3'-diphosphate pyrophosphatase
MLICRRVEYNQHLNRFFIVICIIPACQRASFIQEWRMTLASVYAMAPAKAETRTERVAVIDIGSNSLRLVVYANNGRYPFPLFNERSNCRLGANLDTTGILKQDRIDVAVTTITRFAHVLSNMGVSRVYAVATAAVRRATNAADFITPAEAALGHPIRVLSQSEEAHYVSKGLVLNVPSASGIVADLGGGSLEIVRLEKGKVKHSISLNIGHLSTLKDKDIDKALAGVKWLGAKKNLKLYGVGGSFRALGLAFIEETRYPLSVLHGLKIDADDAIDILNHIVSDISDVGGIPEGRKKTMPTAARIMRALMRMAKVAKLEISGSSIRDGVIAAYELNDAERADFLLAVCSEIYQNNSRFPDVPEKLFAFLKPLQMTSDSKQFNRLLEAACYLADFCWNEHEDIRGDLAARRVLGLPANCVTHKDRIWLALAVYHRHVGLKQNKARPRELRHILGEAHRKQAVAIGLGLRFAMFFSGGTATDLGKIRLSVAKKVLTLHVGAGAAALIDEHAERRFTLLAQSIKCSASIIIED